MVMMEEPQQDPVALVKAVQQLAKEQDGAADGFAAAVQRLWEAVVDITQRGASEHDELCKHATDIWVRIVEGSMQHCVDAPSVCVSPQRPHNAHQHTNRILLSRFTTLGVTLLRRWRHNSGTQQGKVGGGHAARARE